MSVVALTMTGAVEAATALPPLGASAVGDDLYMRPLGLDATGCQAYEPWSMTKRVDRQTHYRRADGSFTTVAAEAACAGEQVTRG